MISSRAVATKCAVDARVPVPEQWLNLATRVPNELPMPLTTDGRPALLDDLARTYTIEASRIELLEGEYSKNDQIDIPGRVLDEYRKYRPTPLCRARALERRLGYKGEIYFKREDCNPTGSHKPNTAIPQSYYARSEGMHELVTDTGAGQWGAALAWACHNMDLKCTVFMTRNSFESKPYRRSLMKMAGAQVFSSPSLETSHGRKLLEAAPDHPGSLGIGMGEALEYAATRDRARVALGCISYYAALHQTVIGQEFREQCCREGIEPDFLIGCVGGGTNFIGFTAGFLAESITNPGGHVRRYVAVESANVPVLTQGRYRYDHADSFGFTHKVKMYTLGCGFIPPEIHAGGLRYHGKSPILSMLVRKGLVEAVAIPQEEAFRAGRMFFECEGILPAPESSHAIAQTLRQVTEEAEHGTTSTIVFCLSGSGYLDLQGYSSFFDI